MPASGPLIPPPGGQEIPDHKAWASLLNFVERVYPNLPRSIGLDDLSSQMWFIEQIVTRVHQQHLEQSFTENFPGVSLDELREAIAAGTSADDTQKTLLVSFYNRLMELTWGNPKQGDSESY